MTNVTYHGDSFIEVEHAGVRLFVDPTFSRTRRGRRMRGETRSCDYVLVSAVTESFDDALDLLEDHENACLVGSVAVCREARRELRLSRDRTFDLEDFERASDGPIRITAVPLTRPTPASSGVAFMEGIGESINSEISRMLARTPFAALPTRGLRQLAMLPGGRGREMGLPTPGEPANGFLLQLGNQNVALFGQGIHDATDERDLEDVASLGPIDTLLVEAVSSVGALVRATRILEPREVLVYRGHDPYGRGRRALAMSGADVPLRSYVEAILDDSGDGVEARVLKPGASVALRATENGRAISEAPRN